MPGRVGLRRGRRKHRSKDVSRLFVLVAVAVSIGLGASGCASYGMRHQIQSDATTQILLSDQSQVKVRNAQSRVFDTTDKRQILQAVIATFQDLGFQIEVLDETLGIVSGKKYLEEERPSAAGLPTYLLYDEESLVVFNRSYRTWGPFEARSDLVRLTVTIRKRNEQQLLVRASAQYALRPVERAEAYRSFYAVLQKSLFAEHSRSEVPEIEALEVVDEQVGASEAP